MPKHIFKVGDIVQLKSGGPHMTVADADKSQIRCQWFAGKKMEHGYFPSESIEPITKS